ncbi:MAG TPA: hypothetical protein VJ830_00045 [Anaerolineales bacterium]|nr:hypothetical protein [Anaerolineales bacterium]
MRRVFRRHIRKTLAAEVPPILQEAIFAFDKGQYGRAGELFEKLAETASARGGARAPIFYLKAGQARILAGQIALGMPSLRRGLELLAERQKFLRLQNAGKRVITELNDRGFSKEASELEALLKTLMPSETSLESPRKRTVLTSRCPSCGGAVLPDEVEWLDDVTAECAYCGSPIR